VPSVRSLMVSAQLDGVGCRIAQANVPTDYWPETGCRVEPRGTIVNRKFGP